MIDEAEQDMREKMEIWGYDMMLSSN